MVVVVLFGVLLLHLVTDFIRNRWRAWQRRKLLANTQVVFTRLEGGRGSGEESECEETTLLIRDQHMQEELEHRLAVT